MEFPNSGRRHATTPQQAHMVARLALAYPLESVQQLQHRLARKCVNVSLSTIKRRLREEGVKY